MSLVDLDHLDNEDLKKRLISLINIDDLPDKCLKYGHPKVLYNELHRATAFTNECEYDDEMYKIWSEYCKRCRPLLKLIKENTKKDAKEDILLEGLERLMTNISNQNMYNMKTYNENMMTLVQ